MLDPKSFSPRVLTAFFMLFSLLFKSSHIFRNSPCDAEGRRNLIHRFSSHPLVRFKLSHSHFPSFCLFRLSSLAGNSWMLRYGYKGNLRVSRYVIYHIRTCVQIKKKNKRELQVTATKRGDNKSNLFQVR